MRILGHVDAEHARAERQDRALFAAEPIPVVEYELGCGGSPGGGVFGSKGGTGLPSALGGRTQMERYCELMEQMPLSEEAMPAMIPRRSRSKSGITRRSYN